MKSTITLIVSAILFFTTAKAQWNFFQNTQYLKVDTLVAKMNLSRVNSIEAVADSLVKPFTTQEEKIKKELDLVNCFRKL